MKRDFVVAVDVGTASVRAGIVDREGRLLARAEHPILINTPLPDHAEQDSENIWNAVCATVRSAREQAGIKSEEIAAIGFDATCSIVVRDTAQRQLSVSITGETRWDTIMWLDHRAQNEADFCTSIGGAVVDHAGGALSPEMATPKLVWLRNNLPDTWNRAGHFFDLADFLTWKATGSDARSQCTLVCKWAYHAHEDVPWQHAYFADIGIPDVIERGNLPPSAVPVGAAIGSLTHEAAGALGLTTDCIVASGMIDAHAGALGALGGSAQEVELLSRQAALIAGTSSCVSVIAERPHFARGFWGPYLGAALPDLWLTEGGQSVSGGLLDHIIRTYGTGLEPDRATHDRICARIAELRAADGTDFAHGIHVLPDFHGNRSPFGDPHAAGVISGLTLDTTFDGLCRLYWRTAVAIALGIRQIVEAMNDSGHAIDTLHVVGGHTKNPILMALYADATGCNVVTPATEDAVLLGSAMNAACAAGWHASLGQACNAMHQAGTLRRPATETRAFFSRDYAVFRRMQAHRTEIERLGSDARILPLQEKCAR